MTTLEIARERTAAGLSILPIRTDGSKAPDAETWKQFQERRPSDDELRQYFSNGAGIGTICGRVSGNLEIIDLDDQSLFVDFAADVERNDPGLIGKLTVVRTPRGTHFYYRCEEIEGNQKLAQRSKDDPLFADKATLIETRGEGGYVVVPGSPPECHELGLTYQHVGGPPLTALPTITLEQRETLFRVRDLSTDSWPMPTLSIVSQSATILAYRQAMTSTHGRRGPIS